MVFPELYEYKKIHFIGIGGVHMSCIAEILNSKGYIVSGSDRRRSKITDKLEEKGIGVFIGHDANQISGDLDLVVKNAAVHDDNPEIIAAKEKNIPIMDRGRILGIIMKNYKYPICIAGVHGKTTTTSMMGEILMAADADPTIVNGGYLKSIDGYLRQGGSDYFVAEACEYHDSFLDFFPYIGIILNIDADHLDYFSDLEHIYSSFRRFAELIPEGGTLVINGEIPYVEKITENLSCNVITFNKGDVTYENFELDDRGCPRFDLIYHGENLGQIQLSTFGTHNAGNSLSAIGAALALNIPFDAIQKGLYNCKGADRRFQFKGKINSGSLFDDYAHHPTEIATTLNSAAKAVDGKVWCVFQPHTKSRTKALFNEFVTCFDEAEKVILVDIFQPPGREENEINISSADLYYKLLERGLDICYFTSWEAAENYIKRAFHSPMLITMGAGDVYLLGEKLIYH